MATSLEDDKSGSPKDTIRQISATETSYDKEEFLGNVSSYMPIPEGYKGPPVRGLLVFDACFESGNLGRVDYINNFEYDLFVRPDTCNSRYRVWFNFTVKNTKLEQRVIFHVVNFSKTRSLYREGMSPLVLSTSRPTWHRIPARNVFYYRSPEHQKNYVMSFAFAFDNEDDTYQSYLKGLDNLAKDYYKREILCYTLQQRQLDIITITSPKNTEPGVQAKVIFITARVHPGESPSSYVCQGIIDYLMSDTPEASTLRDHLIFKIIPMLNPDGVYIGNYRCSLMGFDLNRHWVDPTPWAHPTVHAVKEIVMEYDKNSEKKLDFYIDIHAHSTLTNGFMYGNIYDEEDRFEKHSIFPKLLCQRAHDFSWDKTSFNRDAVKAGTGRRCLGGCLTSQANCYTLEVSFFCYTHKESGLHVLYSEDDYLELGRNVTRTFLDYYHLHHLISSS